MTRISSVEQFRQGIDNILSQQARLNETQLQLSTGKRVNRPSDDPSASTQLLKLSTLKSKAEQYNKNIESARNQLQLQESVLSSVSNVLQRVRELTVQANNATQSNESRAAIADEIYNRIDELLQYANTKDANGEYIFSGFNARSQAFVASGQGYTYQGDQGERMLQISEDLQVAVRSNGAEVFAGSKTGDGRFTLVTNAANQGNALVKMTSVTDATLDDYTLTFVAGANPGDPLTYQVVNSNAAVVATGNYESGTTISFGGVALQIEGDPKAGDSYQVSESTRQDIFTSLKNLADGLNNPNSSSADHAREANNLGGALAAIDQALSNNQTLRTKAGNSLQVVDQREDANLDNLLRIESQISGIEDLDFAEAVSELNLQTVALQAAQQSYIKIQGLSLFNFLR